MAIQEKKLPTIKIITNNVEMFLDIVVNAITLVWCNILDIYSHLDFIILAYFILFYKSKVKTVKCSSDFFFKNIAVINV